MKESSKYDGIACASCPKYQKNVSGKKNGRFNMFGRMVSVKIFQVVRRNVSCTVVHNYCFSV